MKQHVDAPGVSAPVVPQFAIIGAAKSASTWLHLALRQHPSVYMPYAETAFFEDPYYHHSNLGALEAELRAAPPGAVVGIKCPNYLCTPECPARLARHLPHARLIAILRNPVDRAISQYFHLMRSGRIPVAAPEAAFSRYLNGEFDPPYTQLQVMGFGLYAQGIANVRRVFASEQLLVITDLELRHGARQIFERVCRFLQIDDGYMPMGLSVPRNQGAYSTPFLKFIYAMNQIGLIFDSRTGDITLRPGAVGWGARHLAVLGSRLSALTRIVLPDKQPTVASATRQRLLEFYLPDILKLESMINVDLSEWKVLRQP